MDKKIEFPDVTNEDANKFWQEFAKRHPDIEKLLRNGRSIVNGSIGVFQPATVDNNSYKIWERYRNRWSYEHGFAPKWPDLIYVALDDGENKGVRAIDTSTILEIKKVNDNISSITIKENDMEQPIIIYVKEFVEDLKKNVYIF